MSFLTSGGWFSPGPWAIFCYKTNRITKKRQMVVGGHTENLELYGTGYHIAYMSRNNKLILEDAKLIAAAPDLYRACCELLSYIERKKNVETGDSVILPEKDETLEKIISLMRYAVKSADEGPEFLIPPRTACNLKDCKEKLCLDKNAMFPFREFPFQK